MRWLPLDEKWFGQLGWVGYAAVDLEVGIELFGIM
jgi:hypothetical protein